LPLGPAAFRHSLRARPRAHRPWQPVLKEGGVGEPYPATLVVPGIVPAVVSLTGSGDFYLLQGPVNSVFGDTPVGASARPTT
jgi:hypothetical protein